MKKILALILAAAMVLSLVPAVAMAETSSQAELKDAIANAVDGDVIKLGASFSVTTTDHIKVDKAITLDLNGHTVNFSSTSVYGALYISSNGDLTIVGNGGITAPNTVAIGNYGKLTINGGTIEGTNALYNCNYGGTSYGTATINGGTLRSNTSGGNSIQNCGILTIAGGTIEDAIDSTAKLTITGGTIENLYLDTPDYTTGVGTTTSITDGTFTGTVRSDTDGWNTITQQLGFISGGSFAAKPDDSFIESDSLVIDTNKGDTPFMIGEDAKEALSDATSSSNIDVLQASANEDLSVGSGATLNNKTGNAIKINGEDVAKDETVTLPTAPGAVVKIVDPTTASLVVGDEGGKATMSIVAENADSYQWYIDRGDGKGFVKLSGDTSATRTTSYLTMDYDGYRYYCRASNANSYADSPIITLRVNATGVEVPVTGDGMEVFLFAGMMIVALLGMALLSKRSHTRA